MLQARLFSYGHTQRHIGNCSKADPAYGQGVAAALGIAKVPSAA
jgi:catalase